MSEKPIVKLAEELYRETAEGEFVLVSGTCEECGFEMFPIQQQCPDCFSTKIKEELLPTEGELYSYTTLYTAPAGFSAPYSVGNADIGKFRIYGMIEGEEPKIGAKVKVKKGIIKETEEAVYVAYKYKV